MTLQPQELSKDLLQVHNAITNNQYPTKEIALGFTRFVVSFTPQPIPSTLVEIVDFLAPLVKIKSDVGIYEGKDVVNSIPSPLFMALLVEYLSFHKTVLNDLRDAVGKYIETPGSKNVWALLKQIGPSRVFPNNPNFPDVLQRDWILWNLNNDKKELYELIHTVMENLHPWLNPELYNKIKEKEENTRSNWMYDDDELDAKLQKQANEMLNAKKETTVLPDDMDIIEIGENV